jgi:hypothetical protein
MASSYFSFISNIKQMTSGRMRWAGHVARMGDKRKLYKFTVFWDVAPSSHVEVGRSFIALMMEAVRISETSGHFNVTTRRYIPEDYKLHTRHHENLKYHKFYNVLVGKPERKRPVVRPRLRWKDGIRMDLNDTG